MQIQETVNKIMDRAAATGGKYPSLRAIRAQIGGGSLSTISEAVQIWHRTRLVETGEMPASFSDEQCKLIGKALWEVVEPLMRQQVQEIRQKTNARVVMQSTEAAKLMQAAREILAEATDKENRNKRVQKEIQELKSNVRQLKAQLTERDKQLGMMNKALKESRVEIHLQHRACLELVNKVNSVVGGVKETLTLMSQDKAPAGS